MDSRLALPVDTVLDGNYRIMRVVAAGGFGITYEAEDFSLGTLVALKEYYPFEFGDRDRTMSVRPKSDRHKRTFEWGRANFLEEARTLARFEHPSIVRVTRVFEANSTAYMVMRFEFGLSFEDWLTSLSRPPTQDELDAVMAPLLDALQVMHAASFLHRDIAPDNIIIRPDGTPVLLDFGAARRAVAQMSRSLTGIVKAGYSPHEQYASDGRLQGPWSDIYALGSTLYRAVVGRPPEEATLRFDEDRMVSAAQAARGSYRPGFLAAIDACLKVRHSERPQSMAQVRQMLFSVASQPRSGARALAAVSAITVRQTARHWPAIAATIIVIAGVYAGLTYRSASDAEARQHAAADQAIQIEREREEVQRRKAIADAAEERRKSEAAAEERRKEARRIEEQENSRHNAEKAKEDERRRLAAAPSDEQRAVLVTRVQEVLTRSQCYDGKVTGRADETQEGLDRFVDSAGKKGNAKPVRIQLTKASVGDFETWLRDAAVFKESLCVLPASPKLVKTKPHVPERMARARPSQEGREASRPRHVPSEGGGGGDGDMGLVLGIGH